ncbi:hypothetical protein MOQ72_39210 [Saccharopolyspora sp. K220]|uniref:hypothetical protein n=1 Tax=Saccharopolyspora soli TaxID=2926618 RepID=UPI001F57D47A|nr:hypothetical protein [Saccharopolyspora soli]MCI2423458.1 hypothetical protein [Saccharopolyspora soli]
MLYFSQRALNEIDDVQYSSNSTTIVSVAKGISASRATQISLDTPGSTDKVDFALRRAKKVRRIKRKVRRVSDPGCIFDLRVSGLKIGVMPFLWFGDRGERLPNKARVFWAQALIPPSRWRSNLGAYELILLGSLDNVVNESWVTRENELKIGHSYPSDPSVLSMLVQHELGLTSDEVQEHLESVRKYEVLEEGRYARFASKETERAQESADTTEMDSHARSWERPRPPIRKARVVGIVSDVADRIVLARPVLVQDLT